MKCKSVDEHFRSLGKWVNWEKTTDIFSFGSSEDEIEKIAVAWKPTLFALKEAKTNGANLFISHESIGVKAVNGSMKQDIEFMLESERDLFDFMEASSLVVYRCHEFLDAMPEWGVMHAWQKSLQLGGRTIVDEYPNMITEVSPTSVRELAIHIVARTIDLGQKDVLVSGNPEKVVSRIATGTGCIHNIENVRKLGADVSIVVDDAYSSVRMGSHMRDLDYPLIVVNHGVAEEWAMENLSKHLRSTFPDIEVIHIPQYCTYEIVRERAQSARRD